MPIRRTLVLSTLILALFGVTFRKIKFWIRVRLGGLMRFRLRRRLRPWPPRSSPVTLVLAPHQDDEALGCGGLVAHRVAAGDRVHIGYITDGSASHPGHPEFTPAMIAALRADEARVATGILGVPGANLAFLKAPDGQLPHLDPAARSDLVRRLRQLIERVAPSEIFVTSRHDGSTEHVAACALVGEALEGLAPRPRLLEYIVWSRWNPRLLKAALRARPAIHRHVLSTPESALKRNAIRAYRSQVEPLAPWNHSALPPRFAEMFSDPEEFFFEF